MIKMGINNKNITEVVNNNYCAGCFLCMAVCPVGAINVTSDNEGFAQPQIDDSKCINCGKCKALCPECSEIESFQPIKTFVMQSISLDNAVSSSGGIGNRIGEVFLANGGSVIGCELDSKDGRAIHSVATKSQDLEKFAGSKYVQSDFTEVYNFMDNLNDNECVVFGTPCQIAAAKKYAELKGLDTDKLLFVDLICHGVPSPEIFARYLNYLKCDADKISGYRFRDNRYKGCLTAYIVSYTIQYREGTQKKIHKTSLKDPYMYMFSKCEIYRESCYHCQYAKQDRVSDITLGDFPKVLDYCPDLFDVANKGISAVMINTENGQKFYESYLKDSVLAEIKYDYVVEGQRNLREPSHRPSIRDSIYESVYNDGFSVVKDRMKKDRSLRISIIKNSVPANFKHGIKSILKKVKR